MDWCWSVPSEMWPIPLGAGLVIKVYLLSGSLCNLVMQAAGQDALNAAMLIAPNDQIPGS
jgi:hypothetical protein